MKIFSDFHHAGMGQGIQRLFHDRLGHDVYFPSVELCAAVCEEYPQDDGGKVWTLQSENPATWAGAACWPRLLGSKQSLVGAEWDLMLCTRTESLPILEDFAKSHYALTQR